MYNRNLKISVITVCYNSEDTIEQTIQSVLKQNYINKEYIIIDGNSNDNTKGIIAQYEDELSYWCSEPDQGLYDAMNKGIKHSTGDIIAFLNSDDWYEENVLKKVNDYFADTDVDMVNGNINTVINGRTISGTLHQYSPTEIYVTMIYPHQALFVKSSVFKEIGGFDLRYKIAADYDWILKAYIRGVNIKKVDEIFTNCRYGGIGSNVYECALEQKKIALLHLPKSMEQSYCNIIDEYYSSRVHEGLVILACQEALENKMADIKQQYADRKKYYIWGTGCRGEKCYCLFQSIGMEIKGFIDTNKKHSILHGYKVYKPEEIDDDGIICISTKKYENEIIKQIQDMGISANRYLSLYDLQREIAKIGL